MLDMNGSLIKTFDDVYEAIKFLNRDEDNEGTEENNNIENNNSIYYLI